MPIRPVASATASTIPSRLAIARQLDRWLMFGDFGRGARSSMAIAWTCIGLFAIADVVWLRASSLVFARENWVVIGKGCGYAMLMVTFLVVAAFRLRDRADRVAAFLGAALAGTALSFRALIVVAASGIVGVTFSYLATAAGLPLRDDLLARGDLAFGFHWPDFLAATNALPAVAAVLTVAYQSILLVVEGVLVWLAFSGRGERLAEFLAIQCLTSIGVALGMVLVPAAGAFAYFKVAPQLYANFGPEASMWPFFKAYAALYDGSLKVIDLSAVQGVVSFPSFHTVLGIITVYALRDNRWLMAPVALLNAIMIVSTLPVGGHHLMDVLAGLAISIAAIVIVRRASKRLQDAGRVRPVAVL